ncbi:e4d5ba55-7e96-4408-bfa6-a455d9d763fb [Sclerotinia trifoliorum]|uniref:E4d5ba55-7e96-4408-bfa6-a455d9d763fb n=1 Tax=Sclerotinia trifoliorum TaxID=28548 RepID=A0A8H2VZQ0_9HELO|nr:e4d5ba55-7e96-4408-bfa6-a455d9d763fb [Sclerotinia trifoliorum]
MSLIDTIRYNKLPSLEEANSRRQAEHINNVIEGPLRDIFIKYGVQNTFTLYLQHRHHQVHENEAVVKVHSTAHLMNDEEIKDIEEMGNKIVPTTWMSDNLLPMEFAVAPASADTPIFPPDFIAELTNVLASNSCEGLFGIDTLGVDDWTELSIGNASVVVPSNGTDRENYIPVAFAFDEKKAGFRVHGKCGSDHKHTSKP